MVKPFACVRTASKAASRLVQSKTPSLGSRPDQKGRNASPSTVGSAASRPSSAALSPGLVKAYTWAAAVAAAAGGALAEFPPPAPPPPQPRSAAANKKMVQAGLINCGCAWFSLGRHWRALTNCQAPDVAS